MGEDSSKTSAVSSSYITIFISLFALLFLYLVWFVSEPIRAARIDRYALYSIDDIFRFCYIKASLRDIDNFLNPYTLPIYSIIANIFFRLLPFGMSSLRLTNVIFSIGIFILFTKFLKDFKFESKYCLLALFMLVTFPLYILLSVTTHSEIMFCFFLLFSVYLFYSEKYFLSTIFISLLPLIRHEGILYIEIWIFVLLIKFIPKYIPILLMPSFSWGFINRVFLKRSILEAFCYNIVHRPSPPSDTVIFLTQIKFIDFIGYLPFFILFLIGFFLNLFNKKLRAISIFTTIHLSYIIFVYTVVFLTTHTFFHEYRPLVSISPFICLFALYPIKKFILAITKGNPKKENLLIAAFIIIFFLSFIWQLNRFKNDPKVIEDTLTPAQEKNLKIACNWLNSHLEKEIIKNVYIEGTTAPTKIIRRVWMYLPENINYYCSYTKKRILDIIKWRTFPNHEVKGIIVTIDRNNLEGLIKPQHTLVKIFPDVPLYFYKAD